MFLTASLALYFDINFRKRTEVSAYRKILKSVLLILAVLLLFQVAKIFI